VGFSGQMPLTGLDLQAELLRVVVEGACGDGRCVEETPIGREQIDSGPAIIAQPQAQIVIDLQRKLRESQSGMALPTGSAASAEQLDGRVALHAGLSDRGEPGAGGGQTRLELERLLESRLRYIEIALLEGGLTDRERIVRVFRILAGECLELAAGVIGVPAPERHVGEALLGIEIVRLQSREMLEDLDCVIEVMAPGVSPAEAAQRLGVLRLHLQALAIIGDRRIE